MIGESFNQREFALPKTSAGFKAHDKNDEAEAQYFSIR